MPVKFLEVLVPLRYLELDDLFVFEKGSNWYRFKGYVNGKYVVWAQSNGRLYYKTGKELVNIIQYG